MADGAAVLEEAALVVLVEAALAVDPVEAAAVSAADPVVVEAALVADHAEEAAVSAGAREAAAQNFNPRPPV